jgi:tetratricopeptide (TPR) repeat protein
MRLILVVLLSLITVSAFSQRKKSDANAPAVSPFGPELNSALKLASSEQYENAGQAFEALLKKEPANGNVYYFYGETILKDYLSDTLSNSLKEMAKKADDLFRKGIQADPTNELNDVGLGAVVLFRSSDTIAADKFFAKAEASIPTKQKLMTPKDALVLTKLGTSQLLGSVNRFNKALKYLLKAQEIDPNNPAIYLALGDVYISQNDAKNALASYNRALYFDPKSPLPKIKIGNIYMRAPNLNAARPYFEEARDIDSTFAPVYRQLGELYTMAGQFNLSKINFRKFLDMSGDNIPAKIQYAKALFRTKEFTNALVTLEEVLAVDKSRNYLYRLAAYCCYDKKPQELEKGKMYMETFFKNANPESIIPRDYAYYARILFRSAKNDSLTLVKSFDTYKKAYALDSNNVNLITEIASIYYYSHWYKEAVVWLNIKNKKGKPDTEDLMLIGKAYYQLAEFPKADSVFSQIIVNQPDNMQAYLWVARTYSSMDPTSEQGLAKPKFEAMIEKIGAETAKYSKELQEAYSYLVPYYLQKKDYTTSRTWAKKLFDLDPANKKWQIQSLILQATISHTEKKYADARDFFIEIKKLDPAYPNVDKTINDYNKAIKGAAAAAAAQKK